MKRNAFPDPRQESSESNVDQNMHHVVVQGHQQTKKKSRNKGYYSFVSLSLFYAFFSYTMMNNESATNDSSMKTNTQHQVISSLLPNKKLNFTLLEMTLLSEMKLQEKNMDSRPDSPFRKCSATSNVEISTMHTGSNNHNHNHGSSGSNAWILQSLTKNDAKKTVGGDEFYITYIDNNAHATNANTYTNSTNDNEISPTAVAIITDLQDGSYELNFKTTPFNEHPSNLSGTGRLVINLVFTCGIGSMPYPLKNNWTSSGRSNRKLTIENVPQPHLETFTRPVLPNFQQYTKVLFFGDSVIRDMITGDGESVPKYKKIFFRPNVFFKKSVRSHLSLDTLDHFKNHLLVNHGGYIAGNTKNHGNVAIVMGSAVWDLAFPANAEDEAGFLAQGQDFDNHILACKTFIEFAVEKFPEVKIYWKLPSAMHQHLISCPAIESPNFRLWCEISTKYTSSSRIDNLYRKQKALMQEMNVTYLDFHETTYLSAHSYIPMDARHTIVPWNRDVFEWFYPTK